MSDSEGAVFARFIVGDVFEALASIEDGTVDLVVTSPPFSRLRDYLPADHPDKAKEIGHEETPAEFIDTLLRVTAELRRVLAPHGSICVELGDTYAGSGGAGGDYLPGGLRDGQQPYVGSAKWDRSSGRRAPGGQPYTDMFKGGGPGGAGWPLEKSKALIPELYRVALAYGINPLTGAESPAGRWRIRNVVTWCKPNPPVGALGDKWRPATSDIVIACTSAKRYWDEIATRRESPLLDWWELPPGGYPGSHYAVYPPALVEPLIKAMAPPKVCRTCGEPSRRIVEQTEEYAAYRRKMQAGEYEKPDWDLHVGNRAQGFNSSAGKDTPVRRGEKWRTTGWTDCGHNTWRPALILDPFVGSGTTLAVATGHGHDAIGIDLDERNYQLALERVGPLVLGPPEKPQPKAGVGS